MATDYGATPDPNPEWLYGIRHSVGAKCIFTQRGYWQRSYQCDDALVFLHWQGPWRFTRGGWKVVL